MSNNLDKFDKDLKDIIEHFEPEYSSKAWAQISPILGRSYTKWYYIAASVIIVAASIVAYNYTGSELKSNLITKTPTTLIENTIAVKSDSKIVSDNSIFETSENVFVADDKIIGKEKENTQGAQAEQITNLPLPKESVNNEDKPLSVEIVEPTKQITPTEKQIEIHKNSIHSRIIFNSKEGCEPMDVDFSIADLPKDAVVNWNISGLELSSLPTFHHTFKKHGIYTVKLNISTSTDNYSVEDEIEVKESPKADFTYVVDDGLLELENNSTDYEKLSWVFPGVNTDEDNPNFEMLYSGDYPVALTVEKENGCKDKKEDIVSYKVNHHIFAPTAFSPDGDGVNDEFVVKYEAKEGYIYTLQIFNAQGKRLFETQNQTFGWDGKNANSSLNNEKFTWRLIIQDPRGGKEVREALFQIVKH